MKRLFGILLVILGNPGIAVAEDQPVKSCLQKHAIYSNENGKYLLKFFEPKNGYGAATNRFKLEATGSAGVFDGWVVWGNGVSRPHGTITYKCPAGDITGKELDACNIWEGVIYSVWPDGAVDLLPPGDDGAAYKILLPNLGQVLKNSDAWVDIKLTSVPWDVFRFSKCAGK